MNKKFVGFVIINFLLAGILTIGLIWLVFRGIDSYTEHGSYETVPDLRGGYVEEAELALSQQQLFVKIIDSVYLRDKELGIIVEQIPAPGVAIKHNRPVYLIINSRQIRTVSLPQITDYSLRQAQTVLQAVKLNISEIRYVPSEYKELVLDVIYKGESVFPGYKIPEGDAVELVVGKGITDDHLRVVPDLRGLTEEEALQTIIYSSFAVGKKHYESKLNEESSVYLVYKQKPIPGEKDPIDPFIEIWLSDDDSLIYQIEEQENQEEEFF